MVSTISPSDAQSPVIAATEFDTGVDDRSLVFRVSGRAYACQVSAVREVVPLGRVTRLPGAPDTILGLINIRGELLICVSLG